MKKYSLASIAVVVSIVFLGSCISLKIKSILPPENRVEEIQICKGVDESKDLLLPLEVQSEFTSQDASVVCFLRLKDISTTISLRWKWYSPDRKMVRDTGDVMVNQGEKYLETVTACDRLNISEDSPRGQWTVIILVNNTFAGKQEFQVK